ncbi:MAG TPA: SGNH/GDSL hydrolase family protein [Bryobacteraceae bacterium]|nr:SGNH/GDSL hydrolase family protein [Bryobacteraceae bacterium]
MPRLPYLLLFAAVTLPFSLEAQLADQYNPPPSGCCQASAAMRLANALQDWDQLGRFHADDERLKTLPDPNRVVFLGDSITDFWKLDVSFPGKPYVNRGISGQVTSQMLVRMYPDVIDLKPAAVILLAGTNDIARNNGPETITMIEENIMAITELAMVHNIKVILCSVTPIADYGRNKMSEGRPPADILKLNAWMKEYAAKNGAIYCDYFGATVDDRGFLKPGISMDGLHPNAEGYKLMAPVAEAAIQQALRK